MVAEDYMAPFVVVDAELYLRVQTESLRREKGKKMHVSNSSFRSDRPPLPCKRESRKRQELVDPKPKAAEKKAVEQNCR